ncbi:MAG TPA: DUF2508 family protein [Clostridia bacterium]|nr:DUF2508 family protein [Clostridia bacterium]
MSFLFSLFQKKKNQADEYLMNEVRDAWQRWQNALEYFNSVTDPELVECAIYDVEARRRHYMYLVNNIKRQNRNRGGNESSSLNMRKMSKNELQQEDIKWG